MVHLVRQQMYDNDYGTHQLQMIEALVKDIAL